MVKKAILFLKPVVLFFLCISINLSVHAEALTSNKCRQLLLKPTPLSVMKWLPEEGHGVPDRWLIDGVNDSLSLYENALNKIFNITEPDRPRIDGKPYVPRFWKGQFISKLLSARKISGLKNHVLDLFGSGFFAAQFEPQQVDSITGLRWESFVVKNKELNDQEHPILKITPEEVLGDIFNPKTWNLLDNSIVTRSISKFDLVTMNPVGGWVNTYFYKTKSIELNIKALKYIIENVVIRLSDNGHFYFNIPLPIKKGSIKPDQILTNEIFDELKNYIETNYSRRVELTISEDYLAGLGETVQLVGAVLPKVDIDFFSIE